MWCAFQLHLYSTLNLRTLNVKKTRLILPLEVSHEKAHVIVGSDTVLLTLLQHQIGDRNSIRKRVAQPLHSTKPPGNTPY